MWPFPSPLTSCCAVAVGRFSTSDTGTEIAPGWVVTLVAAGVVMGTGDGDWGGVGL